VLTLEALGLVLDPQRRGLKLLPVVLTWVGTDQNPKDRQPAIDDCLIAWFLTFHFLKLVI
jgi:hypothetical protein